MADQEQVPESLTGDSGSGPPESAKGGRWRKLLNGPVFVLSAVVAALAGVAAPSLWNAAHDLWRPPVLVSVSPDPWSVSDFSYALPEVVPPQRETDIGTPGQYFNGSAALRRSVKTGVLGAKITVEGARSHDIVITNMRARILHSEPTVAGTLLRAGPQGAVDTIKIGLNLDEFAPAARVLDGHDLKDPYFANNAITLTDGETAVFQLAAKAEKASYTWVMDIDMVVDGKRQTYTVQPENGPFRVTGYSSRYGSVFEWAGNERWEFPDPARYCPGNCG